MREGRKERARFHRAIGPRAACAVPSEVPVPPFQANVTFVAIHAGGLFSYLAEKRKAFTFLTPNHIVYSLARVFFCLCCVFVKFIFVISQFAISTVFQ